jgi:hypothetical protein
LCPIIEKKHRREENMLRLRIVRLVLFVALALSGSLLWAAEGIVSKVADPSGSSCHLKFPAIKEETLNWARPVLKDPSDGDIIDFYGACNYDPLGKEAILQQRLEYRQRMRREYRSD